MDIVARLRKFMEYRQIPISQFADTCNIPRPTLSQLLNGRNKKVSDEFISKIHDAYPALSVMWLMFGEGNMLTEHGGGLSQPQADIPTIDFSVTMPHAASDKREDDGLFREIPSVDRQQADSFVSRDAVKTSTPTEISFVDERPPLPLTAVSKADGDESKRKVSHIIVYYSDNTFETFVPQNR